MPRPEMTHREKAEAMVHAIIAGGQFEVEHIREPEGFNVYLPVPPNGARAFEVSGCTPGDALIRMARDIVHQIRTQTAHDHLARD